MARDALYLHSTNSVCDEQKYMRRSGTYEKGSMGKLSSIEDVERRQAKRQEQAVPKQARATHAQRLHSSQKQRHDLQPEQKPIPNAQHAPQAKLDMTASEESDFHGISTQYKMSVGHGALIAIAVVVLIVVVAYILNFWLHFV